MDTSVTAALDQALRTGQPPTSRCLTAAYEQTKPENETDPGLLTWGYPVEVSGFEPPTSTLRTAIAVVL